MSGSIILALRLMTAFALYGFLGWALYLLWREIQNQGSSLVNRRVPGISLTVRNGSDFPVLRHFAQPEIILGRDPGCDVPIMDDTVSTRHAQLIYHHGQWWLEDLASMNGTSLNETALSMPTVITTGDEFICGATRITVTLSANVTTAPTQRLDKKNAR
jgi:pSer/pThr/pTyr-binding forkhead associated (FHA) protein